MTVIVPRFTIIVVMAKLIVVALVLISLGAGVYFFLPQFIREPFTSGPLLFRTQPGVTQPGVTQPASPREISTPSGAQPVAESGTTLTTPEDDLTALDKELSDLQNAEAGFSQDLNNL